MDNEIAIQKSKILITGGAGFIGSSLVDHFIEKGYEVIVLDNLVTGHERNIAHHFNNQKFNFIEGDIRDLKTCRNAIKGCEVVLHQAALGSVPRSIKDPITTNEVNVHGFLNILVAARDEGTKRFVYAASSSTYGDSKDLPKVENKIGKPLSPYAITKYVNELYAEVFSKTYGMECIGLRYFNVFGKRQDPNGAYAAVIPLFVKKLINHESPHINGDGSYSRDFTYIKNVIQANFLAAISSTEDLRKKQIEYYKVEDSSRTNLSEVFNIAYGEQTSLNQLAHLLKANLVNFDSEIADIDFRYGETRKGDIPHSLASIEKAKAILGYDPKYSVKNGLEEACSWYFTLEKNN